MATDPMWVFENYAFAAAAIDELEAELAKLRAELERRAVDGWKLVPVDPTREMIEAALLSDDANFDSRSIVITDYRAMLAAAPSAPATVQGVNQQLLEALENTATWIEQLPVPTVGAAGQLVKIDKAIAAARQEGGNDRR